MTREELVEAMTVCIPNYFREKREREEAEKSPSPSSHIVEE